MKIDARERYTLRMPSALFKTLGQESAALGVSLNAFILQILWDWVNQQNKQKNEKK